MANWQYDPCWGVWVDMDSEVGNPSVSKTNPTQQVPYNQSYDWDHTETYENGY